MVDKSMHRNPNWKGGRTISQGYVFLLIPSHPHANSRGYVQEHKVLAVKALGKPLPAKAQIHHFNEIKSDNSPGNLIICESASYHKTLHRRRRAFLATGDPTALRCVRCLKWFHKNDPRTHYDPKNPYHADCVAANNRKLRGGKSWRPGAPGRKPYSV